MICTISPLLILHVVLNSKFAKSAIKDKSHGLLHNCLKYYSIKHSFGGMNTLGSEIPSWMS